MASIIRPRLNDYHNIPLVQEEVDFAIPFLDEDIPLYVDPFLLWKSPSQQDNGLHSLITDNFNYLGWLSQKGRLEDATKILISISECNAVGLGNSKTKEGKRIGVKLAQVFESEQRLPIEVINKKYVEFMRACPS